MEKNPPSESELAEKDFEWFVSLAKNNRHIRKRFRNKYPLLKRFEIKNKLDINLQLTIDLIEQLRHHIVHTSGVVSNKEDFIKKVLKKSGLLKNGKPNIQHKEFIETFFRAGDYKNTIYLLKIPANQEASVDNYIDIFEPLSDYLMAYAHLIVECLPKSMG